jgi:hypothetical protein
VNFSSEKSPLHNEPAPEVASAYSFVIDLNSGAMGFAQMKI